jgi:hypothetical protein
MGTKNGNKRKTSHGKTPEELPVAYLFFGSQTSKKQLF